MKTKDFLKKVLPGHGYYAGFEKTKKRYHFFDDLEQLMGFLRTLGKKQQEALVAIGSFKEKKACRKGYVQDIKSIRVDIDCGVGKPYLNLDFGERAVADFTEQFGISAPLLLGSGNGLHAYYIFETAIAPEPWAKLAEALGYAASSLGLEIDLAPLCNPVQLIRPPGIINTKGGRIAKVISDADTVDVRELARALAPYARKKPKPIFAPENKDYGKYQPAEGKTIAKHCKQIQWAIKNQDEVSEAFWFSMLGVAAYTKDPESTAIDWSKEHKGFDKRATLDKLRRWRETAKGPAKCATLEKYRPGGCKGCEFSKKVGSPAQIGLQQEAVKTPEGILPLPDPYKRVNGGIVFVSNDTDIEVCDFDLYPVSYGYDDNLGYEIVHYKWQRPKVGWCDLLLRQALLAEGSVEFPKAIGDQGIVFSNKIQTRRFQLMLKNYRDQLQARVNMTNRYSGLGWSEKGDMFILGRDILSAADTEVSVQSMYSYDDYNVAGDLDAWKEGTALIRDENLHAHAFAIGVALSAPLYYFTGLKGIVISLYGPTGTGKTLAQYWAQSLYGNPDKLHFTAKFTQNSLFSQLGTRKHLPMTIDEVTLMDNSQLKEFCYWVSQGRDKTRLDINAKERMTKTWALPVIVSTNTSLQEKLYSNSYDSAALQARMIELNVPQTKMFSADPNVGRKIYNMVMSNYGHPGRAFLRYLLSIGPSKIKKWVDDGFETLESKYSLKFSGEERYWKTAMVLADLSLRKAQELGFILFDPEQTIKWAGLRLGTVRKEVGRNAFDCFDVLSEYLMSMADAQITVMHTGNEVTLDYSRMPRLTIRVRFDIYRESHNDKWKTGTLTISKSHLRDWIMSHRQDFKSFMDNMIEAKALCEGGEGKKRYLGKDTPFRLGQTLSLVFDLNHEKFAPLLENAEHSVFGATESINALPVLKSGDYNHVN